MARPRLHAKLWRWRHGTLTAGAGPGETAPAWGISTAHSVGVEALTASDIVPSTHSRIGSARPLDRLASDHLAWHPSRSMRWRICGKSAPVK